MSCYLQLWALSPHDSPMRSGTKLWRNCVSKNKRLEFHISAFFSSVCWRRKMIMMIAYTTRKTATLRQSWDRLFEFLCLQMCSAGAVSALLGTRKNPYYCGLKLRFSCRCITVLQDYNTSSIYKSKTWNLFSFFWSTGVFSGPDVLNLPASELLFLQCNWPHLVKKRTKNFLPYFSRSVKEIQNLCPENITAHTLDSQLFSKVVSW